MTKFNALVRYLTVGGHRKKYEFVVAAETTKEARVLARQRFDAERQRLARKPNALKATITGVVIEEIVTLPPAVPGLVEKADVLDQIRVLLSQPVVPAVDPRVGKIGSVSFDGSEKIKCTVIAVITKLSGDERIVIEDDRGLLSIHTACDLNL